MAVNDLYNTKHSLVSYGSFTAMLV